MRNADRAAGRARLLTVPGLCCSGPDHWQTLWERSRADCSRIELPNWDDPSPADWIAAVAHAVARATGPVLFVAHSLGCHAVAGWAVSRQYSAGQVIGALLVAPPDVEAIDADPRVSRFAPAPVSPLPFRATIVASRDDPYAAFDRSAALAGDWGADLIDVGTRGHVNALSGLGDWPEGQRLVRGLLKRR